MKVICAPDSFKGSLSAVDASKAIAAGVLRAVPDASVDQCPVGDGGEGTLEALLFAISGELKGTKAVDAFGKTIEAKYGLLDERRVAFVESAAVIGVGAIPEAQRDVMHASSYGVGQLMLDAAGHRPGKIIVGVGGTASSDCGCGMAQAIGVRFYDGAGDQIVEPITAEMLFNIQRIDATDFSAAFDDIEIEIASDVDNPLTGPNGAACVYAPQKGASESQVVLLDKGLRHVAELIRHDLSVDIELLPGAGAGGGLGAGLIAFGGARVTAGITTVIEMLRFDSRVAGADLCLTGEGCIDAQSLAGKACIGVARAASKHNVPTIVLAGKAGPGAAQCLDAGVTEYATISDGASNEVSMRRASTLLSDAACRITRKYA